VERSMFSLVLDINFAANDTLFVKKNYKNMLVKLN